MRISDLSSDVCSSDLVVATVMKRSSARPGPGCGRSRPVWRSAMRVGVHLRQGLPARPNSAWITVHRIVSPTAKLLKATDRKSVVEGKRVSVSVDIGGQRINKKKKI